MSHKNFLMLFFLVLMPMLVLQGSEEKKQDLQIDDEQALEHEAVQLPSAKGLFVKFRSCATAGSKQAVYEKLLKMGHAPPQIITYSIPDGLFIVGSEESLDHIKKNWSAKPADFLSS